MNALPVAQKPMQMGMAEQPREYLTWNLTKLVGSFEDAEEATDSSRQLSEKCRDYYDSAQLTADERAALSLRGQPDIVINRIHGKVNYLLGYEATMRTDPKGRPRNPVDEEAADACSDALNYIRDRSGQKMTFSQVWENMLIEGAGGVEIIPNVNGGDAEITIRRVHWDRLFWDPHSRELDFSDARYKGTVIWMDEDDALAQWPDGRDAIAKTISDDAKRTYSDRPRWRQWSTSGTERRRVRVVQMYYRCRSKDGSDECWHWCIFTKGGILENGVVPYRDEDNKSLCPLIMQSAFVDRENNRYGFVKATLDLQDEINKRRSKLLHEASVRQVVIEDGAVQDVDILRQELNRADGVIVVNPGLRFDPVDRTKELSAHSALQTEAKQEIELMGPNASMQGKDGGNPSGRAILANQSGGQIEIAPLVDRHNHFKASVHKLNWTMVRTYWTEEKWINVTDDEGNARFVGFNRPLTLAEVLLKQAEAEGIDPDDAKMKLREAAQNPELAAQLQQVVDYENVPARMEVDIILDEIPDVANVQQEQFNMMVELARSGVAFSPKMLIKASSLRNKQELLDEAEAEQQAAQSDPVQQQAAQLQMEHAMGEIEKLKAEIAKAIADTQKVMAEIEATRASAIKQLAEADMVDAQIGSIVNPAIVSPGSQQNSQPAQSQAA